MRQILSIVFVKKSNFLLNASYLTGFIRFLISFSNLSSFKSFKKWLHHSHFDRLVSQSISKDMKFSLFSQRTVPINPEVSFDILSHRNALLHYV